MELKALLKKNPEGIVSRAYAFSEHAHAGQKRKTGEPYFNHAREAGEILAEWHLDDATIAAGILHDTVEDTPATIADIKKQFGEEIAFIVDGVTKLGKIKYRGTEAKVENLRKMILALSQDLRVIFVKLADRLHNMRTLAALPSEKQKRIALETDEIYAPLAYRLGMQNLAGELHDLAFPYLYPQEDKWLKSKVVEQFEKRTHYLAQMKPVLETALKAQSLLPVTIDFRAKRYSSLYHKLLRHEMDLDKIYDLVAMRVIVATVPECYATLGIVHQIWPPLPGRIKDYIAMPKPNNYRGLHTTVFGPGERIVEIQIRTVDMHEENENGIAAHWIYEQERGGDRRLSVKKMTEEIRWVQQLKNWQKKYSEETDPQEFLQAMKVDFFKDRIFAITPKGEVIDLPAGASPIDFAYQIHTDIGNSCVGAKVNGTFVPLNYELHSGDMVEIMTQKNKKPSENWLEFARTSLARDRIRSAAKKKAGSLRNLQVFTKSELKMTVRDRLGLLKDIANVITRSHVNILNLAADDSGRAQFPVVRVQCDTVDKKKLEGLILKLNKLKEMQEIGYRLL